MAPRSESDDLRPAVRDRSVLRLLLAVALGTAAGTLVDLAITAARGEPLLPDVARRGLTLILPVTLASIAAASWWARRARRR